MKKYYKTKDYCRITFRLPIDEIGEARSVHLAGEFNDWNTQATPLKKLKNGSFILELKLKENAEYQFRYLVDQERWENDHHADRYIPTPFGDSDNFIVIT